MYGKFNPPSTESLILTLVQKALVPLTSQVTVVLLPAVSVSPPLGAVTEKGPEPETVRDNKAELTPPPAVFQSLPVSWNLMVRATEGSGSKEEA